MGASWAALKAERADSAERAASADACFVRSDASCVSAGMPLPSSETSCRRLSWETEARPAVGGKGPAGEVKRGTRGVQEGYKRGDRQLSASCDD